MKILLFLFLLLALPAKADEVAALSAALIGDWQGAGMRQTIRAVAAPELGDQVLYLQMNAGTDDRVTRQRLFILEPLAGGGVAMHFPALKEAERFVDGWADASLFAPLTAEDITAYPDRCAVHWVRVEDRWQGELAGDRCSIISRHTGKTRIIRAFFSLSETRLEQVEQGYDDAGNRLFGEDEPYSFARVE